MLKKRCAVTVGSRSRGIASLVSLCDGLQYWIVDRWRRVADWGWRNWIADVARCADEQSSRSGSIGSSSFSSSSTRAHWHRNMTDNRSGLTRSKVSVTSECFDAVSIEGLVQAFDSIRWWQPTCDRLVIASVGWGLRRYWKSKPLVTTEYCKMKEPMGMSTTVSASSSLSGRSEYYNPLGEEIYF